MKRLFVLISGIGMLSSNMVFGQSQTPALGMPDITLWGRMTMGQVVSSQYQEGTYDYNFQGEWLENIDGGIRLNRQVTPSILGRLNMGFTANASRVRQFRGIRNNVELTAKMFSATLLDASMQYTRKGLIASSDNLVVEFGYFPFKYNPQSTNLGEYLFRTGTYPQLIVSGFENSNVDRPKIAGIHGAWGIAPYVNVDALLNTELDMYPLHDINATVIATGTWPRILTLGFGVQFAHLIVVDSGKTTPGLDTSRYKISSIYDRVWIGYVDTATHDTTLYTFKGTKLMGRATLDIKGIVENLTGTLPFFGKEDLKLYGEAAILGVKNYPGWYNNLSERIPVMAGITWPTNQFLSYCLVPTLVAYGLGDRTVSTQLLGANTNDRTKKTILFGGSGLVLGTGLWAMEHYLKVNTRLDLLSFEIEFFKSPYWNSQEYIWKNGSPVPYTGNSGGSDYTSWSDSLAKTNDDIKWSIYASKKISSWLRLSGQIACDHTPRNWYTAAAPSWVNYTEMVPRTFDWYFMLRTSFYF